MSLFLFLPLILAAVIFVYRKDLRREMFWAGILALPFLVIKPLISNIFWEVAAANGGVFYFLITRLIIGFSFGALASGIYEAFFHKKITPRKHPLRTRMIWLVAGPFAFIVLTLLFHQTFIFSLILGLSLDVILILIIRRDLIWDLIFSGLSMGILYFVIFMLTFSNLPGNFNNFWLVDSLSGITFLSMPVEEIIAVVLFGALWGPLYVAVKDCREN